MAVTRRVIRALSGRQYYKGNKMTYELLVALLTLAALIIGIVKPLFDLNKNITILTESVNQLQKTLDELQARVGEHGTEIDKINITLENHEVRIGNLEK